MQKDVYFRLFIYLCTLEVKLAHKVTTHYSQNIMAHKIRPSKTLFIILVLAAFCGADLLQITDPLFTGFMICLPVVILGGLIYFHDENREPFRQVLRVFALGMLSVPLTLGIHYAIKLTGLDLVSTPFRQAFFSAAMIEEFSKLCIFMWVVWRMKDFDEPFDAMVYACFIALGFAFVENILYVAKGDISVAFMRAVFAVPGHFFDGMIMGYFLAKARFGRNPNMKIPFIIIGLLAAIIAHGTYDFILMYSSTLNNSFSYVLTGVFIVFDYKLWGFSLNLLNKLQDQNATFHTQQVEPISEETSAEETKDNVLFTPQGRSEDNQEGEDFQSTDQHQ